MDLKGKIVLITGATRGIGESCAIAFAKLGSIVVVSGRSEDSGKKVVEKVKSVGGGESSCFVKCDVANLDDQKKLFEKCTELGGASVVIANAGYDGVQSNLFQEYNAEEALKVINCNVTGYTHTVCLGLKHLKENGGGALIGTSSIAGLYGAAATAIVPMDPTSIIVYGASKAFEAQMIRNLRAIGTKDNIRCYAVAPAIYKSKMTMDMTNVKEDAKDREWVSKLGASDLDGFAKYNPLSGRTGHTDDVAKVFVACADGSTKYMTGSSILADCCLTIPGQIFLNVAETESFGSLSMDPTLINDVKGEPLNFKTSEEVQEYLKKNATPF